MKHLFAALLIAGFSGAATAAPDIYFGDDSGDYAYDDQCDDARFSGPGTTDDVDFTLVGRDATDCRDAFENGAELWFSSIGDLEKTDCDATDFGDDSSADANDGYCDDPRFLSFNMGGINFPDDRMADATDCQIMCSADLLLDHPSMN